jgi:2-polyprenyl-3-methyl-5-hydroxy-6-metoxy-1,4-benzoquinol methylase
MYEDIKINNILNSELKIGHKRKYEENTVNSKNIFAKIAHRSRIIKGIKCIYNKLQSGNLLDYGCGCGVFISILDNLKKGVAIGYEPNYRGKFKETVQIFSDFSYVQTYKPFKIITIFEVIEHLSNKDLDVFLLRSNQQPRPKGTGYVVLIRYLYSGFNPF